MRLRFITIATICFSFLIATHAQETPPLAPENRVVGYFSSYSIYDLDFYVTDIDPSIVTHINYRPFTISENGQCVSTDEWADVGYLYPGDKQTDRVRGNINQLQMMRGENPNLKIIMSVGGWDLSEQFPIVSADESARVRFARSCIGLMRTYELDGIDIDWRFPVDGGATPETASDEDTSNFVSLLRTLREELDEASDTDDRSYLLTALVPSSEALYQYFDLGAMHPYLDWMNVSTYGYTGAWSEVASPHAPLYASQRDPRSETEQTLYNVDGTVNDFLNMGVPAEKIVIGLGFYAQTWSNVRPNEVFGLYEPATGIPTGTRANGTLYYRDIGPLLESDNYTKFFDEETKTAWMYNADRRVAVSYENPRSIQHKVSYVERFGLGGIMIFEVGFDDDQQTLTRAIEEAFSG